MDHVHSSEVRRELPSRSCFSHIVLNTDKGVSSLVKSTEMMFFSVADLAFDASDALAVGTFAVMDMAPVERVSDWLLGEPTVDFPTTVKPLACSQEWNPLGGLPPIIAMVFRRVGERA